MNSDHKAVITRIELSIVHKTQYTQRSKKKTKKESKGGDTQLNWNEHTISIHQAHQELALNTTNHNTTTNHKTTEDLNDKLEHTMTNTASTTQNEQLQDNTIMNNDIDGSH